MGRILTACQTRDKTKQTRVLDTEAADLSCAEDGTCSDKAPVATHPQLLDDYVRTYTYAEVSFGAITGIEEAWLVPLQRRPTKLQTDSIDTCMSWCCWMNPGVTLSS